MVWTPSDISDQTGRVAIVTGANSGIGFETALELARKGATVVLACRNQEKGQAALDRIVADGVPVAPVLMALDLSSLASVAEFSESFHTAHGRLDLLLNNAGVMIPPLSRTQEGFELQFGTNHLGHFALTLRLVDLLEATTGSRVVNVSSNGHRFGTMDFDDPNYERRSYSKMGAYGQSKLANLLFTHGLNARLADRGISATSAHPGWTASNLARTAWWADLPHRMMGQSAQMGALPTLRAALDPDVEPGDYFGPRGMMQTRGYPVKVGSNKASRSEQDADRLWAVSEDLTGVSLQTQGREASSA
jgi:NAD(P)-dependent dehydrogenase (short-subunit alcohol dehydrogenase family)